MCLPAPKDPVGSVASSPRTICPCCIQDHHSPLIACVLTPHPHHPSTAVCHPGHVTLSEAHHLKHIVMICSRAKSSQLFFTHRGSLPLPHTPIELLTRPQPGPI